MSDSARDEVVIGGLDHQEFSKRLAEEGVGVRIGPFDVKLRSTFSSIAEPLHRLYRDYPLLEGERVFSFHLRLTPIRSFPRVHRPLVRLTIDGRAPHENMPRAQALAVLEWGLNLVIAFRTHSLLTLHSGAVERNGGVMLLPAWPGYGKTTLCTSLVHRGWRLLSDEFGLVHPSRARVLPLPRPMPLKNESIDVIRATVPEAELGPVIRNTRKGTIAHVKPPAESIRLAGRAAPVRWIVFPRWVDHAATALEPVGRAEAFMTLAANAFNYEMLGEVAFAAVRRVVGGARSFRLVYSDLEEAVALLSRLAAEDAVA